MPRISVLLTSYNHAAYLHEAINSVLTQTYTDFELLIVDDNSTDDSWGIINSYDDARIRAFKTGERTITAEINRLIAQEAKGEFIAIFHSDDVWGSDKLALQLDYLAHHQECGAVFTQAVAIGEDSQPLTGDAAGITLVFAQPNRTRQQWLRHFFYQMNALCHPSVLIRSQCYRDAGLYRETFWALDDFDLWVRICLRYEIHVLEQALTYFRVRTDHGNVSGDRIETHVRTATEFIFILRHYLTIKRFEDMVAIFPEAEVYYRPAGFEPRFVLAMMALAENSFPQTRLFGLGLLFELLENNDTARLIDELYGFKPADFHALKIQHDVFRIKQLHDIEQRIDTLERVAPIPRNGKFETHKDTFRLWGDDARMHSQVGMRTAWGDIETTNRDGFLLYGPYLPFSKGHYQFTVRGTVGLAGAANARCDVSVRKTTILVETTINETDEEGYLVRMSVYLPEDYTDVEFRIWVSATTDLRISSLEFSPVLMESSLRINAETLPYEALTQRALKIVLIGNCQVHAIAQLIEQMAAKPIEVRSWVWNQSSRDQFEIDIAELNMSLVNSDLILFHQEGDFHPWFEQRYPHLRFKTRTMPRIIFGAWHPDLDIIFSCQEERCASIEGGLMEDYQSTLAFYGWKQGMDIDQTLALFAADVYQQMGYFDCYAGWKAFLAGEGEQTGLPLAHLIDDWSRQGCWMYSVNHPKLFVLADIARELMRRENIAIDETVDAITLVEDAFSHGTIWPIYPEIAAHYGLSGDCIFRSGVTEWDLREFVATSFARFEAYKRESLASDTYDAEQLKRLHEGLHAYLEHREHAELATLAKAEIVPANPYGNLPDYHFWGRAVTNVSSQTLDPVVHVGMRLHKDSRIATAGSCFAQHIAHALQQNGYPYYITESSGGLNEAEAKLRNYGVYSARYGNIYTARQLLQLFDRAYGDFIPGESAWLREDGRLADPFRPQIEPDGFEHLTALEQSRKEQFGAVRELFETLDVFIFTLGLTEAWRNRRDGAVYPLAPGVVAGAMNPREHEFVNFNTVDVIGDLQAFINRLLRVNPKARMILTVSPVPLIATYEDKHVLEANTYSKSVLRAAAEEVCRRNAMCAYFPAYEMVTGHYNHGAWFEDDLRSVRVEGVEHVMCIFFAHYVQSGEINVADGTGKVSQGHIKTNYSALAGVVCEEVELDRDRNQ